MIKISFTGDAMIEHSRLNEHKRSNGEYNFDRVFEKLKPLFNKSDFVVANLETPLAGDELVYSEKNYSFNTPTEFGVSLKIKGVDMVTTANNHVLDRGIEGLKNTIDALDGIGLLHTGSFANEDDNKPLLVKIGDEVVSFISYTYGTEACFNGFYLKDDQKYMVNLLREQELSNKMKRYLLTSPSVFAKGFRFLYRIILPKQARLDVSQRKERDKSQLDHLRKDIKWSKEHADYSVLCLHCGGQFDKEPTSYTKKTVELCLNEGIDAIIGNHEHILHPVMIVNDHIIAYCLGNLTSDYGIRRPPYDKLVEYSAILHLYIEKRTLVKATITLVKSVINEGQIVCETVSDLLKRAENEEMTNLLDEANRCIETVTGNNPHYLSIPEEIELCAR